MYPQTCVDAHHSASLPFRIFIRKRLEVKWRTHKDWQRVQLSIPMTSRVGGCPSNQVNMLNQDSKWLVIHVFFGHVHPSSLSFFTASSHASSLSGNAPHTRLIVWSSRLRHSTISCNPNIPHGVCPSCMARSFVRFELQVSQQIAAIRCSGVALRIRWAWRPALVRGRLIRRRRAKCASSQSPLWSTPVKEHFARVSQKFSRSHCSSPSTQSHISSVGSLPSIILTHNSRNLGHKRLLQRWHLCGIAMRMAFKITAIR